MLDSFNVEVLQLVIYLPGLPLDRGILESVMYLSELRLDREILFMAETGVNAATDIPGLVLRHESRTLACRMDTRTLADSVTRSRCRSIPSSQEERSTKDLEEDWEPS
jgi:hypothetical protein